MALRNLIKRKLRTFLTVLGVIIGTASIIIMISLGLGMTASFQAQIEQWGDIRLINVYAPYNGGGATDLVLDDLTVAKFEQLKGVDVVAPIIEQSVCVKIGKYQAWLSIRGMDADVMQKLGYNIDTGDFFQDGEKNVFVAGSYVSTSFYNPQSYTYNPVTIDLLNEKNIQLLIADPYDTSAAAKKYKPIKITFSGTLQSKDYNSDYYIFTPLDDLKAIMKQINAYRKESYNDTTKLTFNYTSALVRCADIKTVKTVLQSIQDMGFDAYSPTQQLDAMQQTSGSLQMPLGAMGVVSLFVAAIGIANTMMMAIFERTKEIGIMKVIGASLKDINRLFLTEAALIGVLGGLLGVGLSEALSYILNHVGVSFFQMYIGQNMSGTVSIIPIWLSGAALLFSAMVGIISGYFPARRAMKLSAISAIRADG